MSNVVINDEYLTNIANAIRGKKGAQETFTPPEMATEITNLPSGGGSSRDWTQIGYSSEPQIISDDFAYSKQIYDNWDSSVTNLISKYLDNKFLTYMPLVNTSNATSMNSMFKECESLKVVPLLITTSVTDMNSIFYNCRSLSEVPQLDTQNVTSMASMFYGCERLTSVPFLNSQNVTSMNGMFTGCYNIETVPQFNTSKVTSMKNMFYNCTNIKNIPLFDTSLVKDMTGYVSSTSKLTDTSLDNILQMCINATGYTQTKALNKIGFASNKYPASRIQALPHYQDFIDAGWTIGY